MHDPGDCSPIVLDKTLAGCVFGFISSLIFCEHNRTAFGLLVDKPIALYIWRCVIILRVLSARSTRIGLRQGGARGHDASRSHTTSNDLPLWSLRSDRHYASASATPGLPTPPNIFNRRVARRDHRTTDHSSLRHRRGGYDFPLDTLFVDSDQDVERTLE